MDRDDRTADTGILGSDAENPGPGWARAAARFTRGAGDQRLSRLAMNASRSAWVARDGSAVMRPQSVVRRLTRTSGALDRRMRRSAGYGGHDRARTCDLVVVSELDGSSYLRAAWPTSRFTVRR